jgi:uncharacterized protein YjlB
MQNFYTYFFGDDGTIPNSHLPLVVYPQVADNESLAEWFLTIFAYNNWGNNWQDVVLPYDHFHSNTHEVLALVSGSVSLKIGGKNGKVLHLTAGDVLIIPAGMGHYSVSNHANYQFVGGYPEGKNWDLRTGLPAERPEILENIALVALPSTDPVFGKAGMLLKIWT